MSQQTQETHVPAVGALHRVATASDRIRHLRAELAAEYERRGLAVVEAVDEGHSYRQIGAVAHVQWSTIYKAYADWA